MKQPKKINKTVIFISYQCNNNCIFCMESEKRNLPSVSTDKVIEEMKLARKRGTTYLELIGGEVTIRKDAVDLIKYAKKIGFKTIMMATNGRLFSYYSYAKELVKAGLTDIVFSIHGHNAKLHDSLTNSPGSFKELKAGIDNIKKLKLKKIGSNTTIVKQNYKHLSEIGKFILSQGIKNSEFIFVDCNYGGAKLNFQKLVPKISQAAPYIRRCLDMGKELPHWHVRYVPLCYFTDNLKQISELDEIRIFKTEHIAQDFINLSVESSRAIIGRTKTEKCKLCLLYDKCEGIWKEYIAQYGDKELRPIK